MFRSTAALAATLALSATALMPAGVSALEARSTGVGPNYSGSFALATDPRDELKNTIGCGPGSSSPFTPCEDIKRFCALMGGDYEPGSCTLPDWPPPPSRD